MLPYDLARAVVLLCQSVWVEARQLGVLVQAGFPAAEVKIRLHSSHSSAWSAWLHTAPGAQQDMQLRQTVSTKLEAGPIRPPTRQLGSAGSTRIWSAWQAASQLESQPSHPDDFQGHGEVGTRGETPFLHLVVSPFGG